MAGPERLDAFALMERFCSDRQRLGDALNLYVEREDYGFVWLAYREDAPVGCCSVGYAIAADAGGLVALVRDIYVRPEIRRSGVATGMLAALDTRLAALPVVRIETPAASGALATLLAACGYTTTDRRLLIRDR